MKQRDDNDRLQDGDLPEDPEADAELMPDPNEERRRQDREATAGNQKPSAYQQRIALTDNELDALVDAELRGATARATALADGLKR